MRPVRRRGAGQPSPRSSSSSGRSGTAVCAARRSIGRRAAARAAPTPVTMDVAPRSAACCCSRPLRHDRQLPAQFADLCLHLAQTGLRAARAGNQDQIPARSPRQTPCRLPQQPLGSVALHRTPDPPRRHDGHPGRPLITSRTHMHRRQPTAASHTAERRDDVVAVAKTLRCGHDAQADSFARPRRRRSLMTRRPPRVRIRARKPCFFERRRWLGWKVRFTACSLGRGFVRDHPQPGTRTQKKTSAGAHGDRRENTE